MVLKLNILYEYLILKPFSKNLSEFTQHQVND